MITRDAVKLSAVACLVLAGLALASSALVGLAVGASAAAGLLAGAANGFIARTALDMGIPMGGTALFRLLLVSAAALAAGFALGSPVAALLGAALASVVLAGSAAFTLTARR